MEMSDDNPMNDANEEDGQLPINEDEEDSIEQYISEQVSFRRSEGSQYMRRTNSILEVTEIDPKQSSEVMKTHQSTYEQINDFMNSDSERDHMILIDPKQSSEVMKTHQSTYEQKNDFMNSDSERDHMIMISNAPRVLTQSVLLLNSDRSDKQSSIQNPEFNSQNIFPLDPNSLDSPQLERRNTVPQKPSKKQESAKQRISLGDQQPRLSTPHLKEESNFNINTLSIHQSQHQKTLSYQQSSQGKESISQHSEELARIVRIYIEELSFTTNEAGSLHRSFSFDNNLIEQNQKNDKPYKNTTEKIRQHIIKGMFELLIVGQNNFHQYRDPGESPQVLVNSIIQKFEGPNQLKPVMVSSFTSSKKDKESKLNIITSFTPVDQIQTSDDILRTEIDKLKNDIEVLKGQNEIAELRMMEYYTNEQTFKSKWMEGEEVIIKLTTLNQQLNSQIQSLETKQDQQQTDLVSQIKEREEQLYKLQSQYLFISNKQIHQQQSSETEAIQTYNNFIVQRNKLIQNNEVSRSTPPRQPRLLGLSNQSGIQRQMNRDQCFSQSSMTSKLTPPRPPSQHYQHSLTKTEQSPSQRIEFKQFPTPNPYNNRIPSKNESINSVPDTQYRGDLVNGIRSGRGTYNYEDGKVYQGSWQNNMRDGYGILRFSDKDIYSGNWLNDMMHGCGFLFNRNFIEAQETIHHSNLNGQSQWMSYKGQFRQNKFEGFGVLMYSKGQKFQGEFKNGSPNGRGTFYNSKGEVQHGLWVDGKISKNF